MSPEPPRRQPAPNYRSRAVQWRLLVLVSMFMLVLLAMDKARDPSTWAFLWAFEDQAAEAPREPATSIPPAAFLGAERVDTKLPRSVAETDPHPSDSITTTPQKLGEVPTEGNADQRVLDDLWAHLLQSLETPQQLALDRGLYLFRHDRPLDESSLEYWPSLLQQLTSRGGRYFKEATRATGHAALVDNQLEAWLALLEHQESDWRQTLNALSQLANPEIDISEEGGKLLAQTQGSLDRLAFANIKDNTVHRPAERRAWFRFCENLMTQSPEAMTSEAERVGFVQIFRQPDLYRGKAITLHGTVRRAYRLAAPRNSFDVEQYTVLWIRPFTNPDSPVVVYSLGLPPGFPPVVSRDDPGQAAAFTELKEEVDITGYYFKNWAYPSQQGINTAPLVLTRAPVWFPGKDVLTEQKASLDTKTMWGGIGLVGLLAIGLALLAYRSTQYRRTHAAIPGGLDELSEQELPTPSEHLQKLSEESES